MRGTVQSSTNSLSDLVPRQPDRSKNRTIQLWPVKITEIKETDNQYVNIKDKLFTDNKYGDIRLEKLSYNSYEIKNKGDFASKIIYFEDDYYEDDDYEKKFDISRVSVLQVAPTLYDHIGEQGRGVGFVSADTTLRTEGLLSCVGWLLYNNSAAYLTHIVVREPAKVKKNGSIKKQVDALCELFRTQTGTTPTHIHIRVDPGNLDYDYQGLYVRSEKSLQWMKELEPEGCTVLKDYGTDLQHVVRAANGKPATWSGMKITVE